MDNSALKAFLRQELEDSKADYAKDLDAMSPEQLGARPGGKARTGYDMTYEVAFVNRRLAARLRGETPEEWKFEGWMTAPNEFRDKPRAIAAFTESVDEILAAFDAIPDGEIDTEIEAQGGPTSAVKRMFFASFHIRYHDAQLNYIQALFGDDAMHWM